MGTLSGERKAFHSRKHSPIRDRRAAGCRVELPDRRPSSRPALDAGARLSFLPILFGGGRQATGREHFKIERVWGASIPAKEKVKCALIWRSPQLPR